MLKGGNNSSSCQHRDEWSFCMQWVGISIMSAAPTQISRLTADNTLNILCVCLSLIICLIIDTALTPISFFGCRLWYQGPQPSWSSCSQTLITMWEWLLCIAMARAQLSVTLERHVRTQTQHKSSPHKVWCYHTFSGYMKMFTLYVFMHPQCRVVDQGTCRYMTQPPAHSLSAGNLLKALWRNTASPTLQLPETPLRNM